MLRINHALIMAAGRGMRMAPLTDSIPKPMAPVNGTTLIASGVQTLRAHLENIHITVGYKGAMLAQHVIEHDVTSVHNTEGRPNSWWVYNSLLRSLDEPIFVLTCDNVVELDFAKIEEEYRDLGSPANMIVPVKVIPGYDGDFIKCDGNKIVQLGRDIESDIYCSGIQVLNPAEINRMTDEENSFYDIWRQLMNHGALFASSTYPKTWRAIDTVEQLVAFDQHERAQS